MTLPLKYDCRKGIKQWLPLGNLNFGDCTVAAYLHVLMMHNLATTSSWEKLLYRIGFTPPTNKIAVEDYTAFLATLGERPSGTQGVDPGAFLTWRQSVGEIKGWMQLPAIDSNSLREAMIQYNGVMLSLELTNRAYSTPMGRGPWVFLQGDTPNPMLGHEIAMVAYNNNLDFVITWGYMTGMTEEFATATVYAGYVFW